MKILITGYPGTGKTTIAKVLKDHGRNAYDPQQMRSYMHVEDADGRRIRQPEPVPRGWFDSVGSYNWDPVKIERLLSSKQDIFICSLAHNQSQFYELFDKILLLVISDDALKLRLESRAKEGGIGADPDEMNDILTHKQHFEDSLLDHGATPIDTGGTIQQTIDTIIQNAV